MLIRYSELKPFDVYTIPNSKEGAVMFLDRNRFVRLSDKKSRTGLHYSLFKNAGLKLMENPRVELVGRMELKVL